MKKICLLLFLLVALAAAGCNGSSPADYSAVMAEGRAAVKEVMDSSGVSSLSVAVVDGDRVVWAETFGQADKAAGAKPSTDTMYGIGSTSKMLAAIAVMKLVDQGKVALDDPLVRHLPSFSMLSPEYTAITVRMLLNHSSGLPGTDYRNSIVSSPVPDYSRQVLETLKSQYLKHPPGYLHVYCNDGFTLLEELVKAKTGKDFAWFVQDEIFTPLGMNHSAYPLDFLPAGSFATAYQGDQPQPQEFANPLASGGLYTTPSDMAKIAMMFMNGGKVGAVRILSERSVREMGQDQTAGSFDPSPSAMFRYGLGWDTVAQAALQSVGVSAWVKGGDSNAYSSALMVAPGEHAAVVVCGVSGFSSTSAEKIGTRIMLRLLAQKGRIPAMPEQGAATAAATATPAAGEVDGTAGIFAGFDTVYRASFPDPATLSLERYNGETRGWEPKYVGLKYRQDGWFVADGNPALKFSFKKGDGRWYLVCGFLMDYAWDQFILAQRIPDGLVPDANWNALTGKRWLVVNEHPDILGLAPALDLLALPDIQSPLFVYSGASLTAVDPSGSSYASMMLLIPGLYGRDLNGLSRIMRNNQTWLKYGSYVYRPLDSVESLANGDNSVAIGTEGYAEWRSLPAAATAAVVGGYGQWKLFDANWKLLSEGKTSGTVAIPQGAGTTYLLLYGLPYASRTVSVT